MFGSQGVSSIIMMVVLFVVLYFMMIKPQKKKDKETKDMRDSLSIGDEVITIGGIHGKVVKVNDELVTLEMAHAKTRIEFSRWAVGSVPNKGKSKEEAPTAVADSLPDIPEEETKNDQTKSE